MLARARITSVRARSTLEKTGIALGLALATLLLHLATDGRYDFFRDELYFIVCGRHPAFGYVDQPPLVPLWAAFSQLFGENLLLLRLPAAVAAAATVYVVCALARLAGAGRFGEFLAGFAFAFAPMSLGIDYELNTTNFEGLAWTLCAYLVMRRIVLDDRRAMIRLGVVVGIALEIKYALPFYLMALAIGLLCTPQRRIILTRETGIATIIAVILAAPSIVWQGTHGSPTTLIHTNAQISVSTPRMVSNSRRDSTCTMRFATTLRAARNPIGNAITAAPSVPRKAMPSVSPSAPK